MRIVCFTADLSSGGAQRQLVGLAHLLKEKGHEVTILTHREGKSYSFYEKIVEDFGVNYVKIQEGKNHITLLWNLRRVLIKLSPDVLISYLDFPNMMSCLLKASGLSFKLLVSARNTTQKITLLTKFKLFTYRWADYIVPNSYTEGDFISRTAAHLQPKIKVITNYTDVEKFVPMKQRSFEGKRILVVARVTEQKNVIRFIQSIAKVQELIPEIKVDWYGGVSDSDSTYFIECRSEIKKHHLEDVFTFHEPTLNVLALYQSTDYFCLPSMFEGYPNALCEAMCCGIPVLAGNVCDNNRIVADGKNGFLFDPLNVDDMVDKILKILKLNVGQRRAFGAESRCISERLFSKQTFIAKYEDLIKDA